MYAENQDEMRDHNHEVFSEYFKNQDDWIMDYVQSDDYMGDYEYIIWEGDQIDRSINRLLERDGYLVKGLADYIVERIQFYSLTSVHCVDEYASEDTYSLDSFQIGEYENQLEISSIKEEVLSLLTIPNDRTSFEDILAEYIETSRDHCLCGTLSELNRQYTCMYQYVLTGLRVEFYLTDEQWQESLTLGIIEYCRHVDRNRRDKISAA